MGKHQNLLRDALGKIAQGTFSELDVLALLILARQESAEGSILRELGDFAAHRIRDRGVFAAHVAEVRRQPRDRTAPPLVVADFEDLLNENPVFDAPALRDALAALARSLAVVPPPVQLGTAITLVIISLLQGALFQERWTAPPKEVGRVLVAMTHHYIAAVYDFSDGGGRYFGPLLSLPNSWYKAPVDDPIFLGILPEEEMRVECIRGEVTITL